MLLKIKSTPFGCGFQPVDKPVVYNLRSVSYAFCFFGDMCGGKTPGRRKPPFKAVFKGRGWYWREWSAVRKPVSVFGERHFRPGECRLFRHSQIHTRRVWIFQVYHLFIFCNLFILLRLTWRMIKRTASGIIPSVIK